VPRSKGEDVLAGQATEKRGGSYISLAILLNFRVPSITMETRLPGVSSLKTIVPEPSPSPAQDELPEQGQECHYQGGSQFRTDGRIGVRLFPSRRSENRPPTPAGTTLPPAGLYQMAPSNVPPTAAILG